MVNKVVYLTNAERQLCDAVFLIIILRYFLIIFIHHDIIEAGLKINKNNNSKKTHKQLQLYMVTILQSKYCCLTRNTYLEFFSDVCVNVSSIYLGCYGNGIIA